MTAISKSANVKLMGGKSNILTPKQERFVRNVFSGMTQRQSWIQAGYSSKYPVAVVDSNACSLFNTKKIQARYKELQAAADDATIMPVKERRQRLSEIARARLTDYVTEKGIKIDKDSPNTAALQAVRTRIQYHKKGTMPEIVTDIKLHSPTEAIDLLNKIDHIYSEPLPQVNDNRQYNILVADEVTKQSIARLLSGERRQEIVTDGH